MAGALSETEAALVARAAALVPALRDRAQRADALRRVPEETHADFVASGFYDIFLPARYGGLCCGLPVLVAIAAELGRGCGSSAWLFSNLVAQSWITGMAEPAAQDDVWGANPKALIASAFPVKDATVRRAEGGFVLDGLWSFSSGVDYADWLNLQIFVPGDDGPPEHRFALVPRGSYEIVDDWFASGLLATGSKSVRLAEVFVPEHRAIASMRLATGDVPGAAMDDAPIFRIPPLAIGSQIFAGVALGLARGAIEHVIEDLSGRTGVMGPRVAELPTAQTRVAEADAEADAAAALLAHDAGVAMRYAEADEAVPLLVRAKWRRNNAFATQLCVRAVERLYTLMGARGLDQASPFMRAWRDIHAVQVQITQSWDIQAVNAGRIQFGLPSLDPRL